MGTLSNKMFRGGRIQRDTDNMATEYTWAGTSVPAVIITAIKDDLALTNTLSWISGRYVLLKDVGDGILIGFGNKIGMSFQVAVTAEATEAGYLAEWNVLKWTTADAMPANIKEMEALRERVLEIARKNGGTDIQAHVPPPKN